MASTTPNIGLTLPTGAEKVSRQIINDNNTIIDGKMGAVPGGQNLQGEIDALNSKIDTAIGSLSEQMTNIGSISGGDHSTVSSGGYIKMGRVVVMSFNITFSQNITANEVVVTGSPIGNNQYPIFGFKHAGGERGETYSLRTDDSMSRMYANDEMASGTYIFTGVYISKS